MNSSLRAMSLIFASTALLLGPGQAIAGDDWGKGGDWDKGGDWGKGDDWDKDDDWDGDDIRNLRVCYDDDKQELRVKFDYRDNGWYDKHHDDYNDNRDVQLVILDGEAVCEKSPGRGRGHGLRKVEDLYGVCLEEEACHTSGCGYEAIFDLEDLHICKGNRDLCSADIDKVLVAVGYEEPCEVHVTDCHGGW